MSPRVRDRDRKNARADEIAGVQNLDAVDAAGAVVEMTVPAPGVTVWPTSTEHAMPTGTPRLTESCADESAPSSLSPIRLADTVPWTDVLNE